MTRRHTTGPMHPLAVAWHNKRRLREHGRISVEEWKLWVAAYINALEPSPWREFCQRETHRIIAQHLTFNAERRRRDDMERMVTALDQ